MRACSCKGRNRSKLAAKDFDTFTIERKAPQGETMAFQRIGETQWKMIKPDEARVDSSAVDRAIDDLLSARRESKGEGSKDLKQLGLEPPSLVMTLAKSGGPTFTVSLGNTTPGTSGNVFAVTNERPNAAMAIRRTSLSALLRRAKKRSPPARLSRMWPTIDLGICSSRVRDSTPPSARKQ